MTFPDGLIDRDDERHRLQAAAQHPPQLVVLRGRRRAGKSFLLAKSLEGHRSVFFQADEQPERGHLDLLATECARLLPGGPRIVFSSWDEAFGFFRAQATVAPLIVVLDEFQWLKRAQPALDSILMRHWDRWQRDKVPLSLVVSGSALSLMVNLLAHGNPLYGRANYRPLIEPFDYRIAAAMAPSNASAEELLRRYAVLGGTPQYQVWAGAGTVARIIPEKILAKGEALYEEPLHLLREEQDIRDPGTYFAILRAIADGATQHNEIARQGNVRENAAKMLARLEELGYVEKRAALSVPSRAPRTSYRISDPFFRFWFRFVFPNRSRLELGRIKDVAADISRDLDTYIGPIFEDCCRTWLGKYADVEQFPTSNALGSWWSRDGQTEIDVAGMTSGRYSVLGSCKWSVSAPARVLGDLLKARDALGAAGGQARLMIFARGFSQQLTSRASKLDVALVPAARMFA